MKKVLVAVVCCLGAVACGEGRPAEDPSRATSTTTEITSTSAARKTDNAATGNTTGTTNAAGAGRREGDRNADGSNATTGSGVQMYGGLDGNAGNTGNAGTTVSGSTNAAAGGNAPSVNNPGVANGTKDADNTKINDRDRHGAVTPTDQGGGKDRDITAAIRRAVVGDGALSFTAKNVKIITVGGKVTLRGPVKSDAEKTAIEAKAKAAAGVTEVDNQLEVKK